MSNDKLWFHVMDMHSGGRAKFAKDGVPVEHFFIEAADRESALKRFFEETRRDVDHVTCKCCGSDYSADSQGDATLEACADFWVRCEHVDINGPKTLVLRAGDTP